MGKFFTLTVGLLVALLLVTGCNNQPSGHSQTPPPPPPAPPPAEETVEEATPENPGPNEPAPTNEEAEIIRVDSASFEGEVLEAEELVVVDFWAEWCVPCKLIEPILQELAPEYAGRVKFASLDVEESQDIAQRYKLRSIPCLIGFKDGTEVGRLVGYRQHRPKEYLSTWIDQMLQRIE